MPLGRTSGLAKSLVLQYNLQHLGFEGVLWELAGANVAVKAGVGEVNGDSAARNKPKKKRGGAEQKKKGPEWPRAAIPFITSAIPFAEMLVLLNETSVLLRARGCQKPIVVLLFRHTEGPKATKSS